MKKKDAVLLGPFVGEFYWEVARFAPLLPKMVNKEFKDQKITYIVFTREERFDLYGKYADILVPLRIKGDYENKFPNCFRLNSFSEEQYKKITHKFHKKYEKEYNIIKHITPFITKNQFLNKNQYPKNKLMFNYQPRSENYEIVKKYLPRNNKQLIVLAPRFRKGFRRNWDKWEEFYDLIHRDKQLMNRYNFIICGKKDEYISDSKDRFLDINKMVVGNNSSLAGLLMVILEKARLVCGSQSAIPNMGLLYKVEVLEFGCQKNLHTKTYNIHKTPVEFIVNKQYNIPAHKLFNRLKKKLT